MRVHHHHRDPAKRPAPATEQRPAKRPRVEDPSPARETLPRAARRPLPPEWTNLESDTDDAASAFELTDSDTGSTEDTEEETDAGSDATTSSAE